nr:immunoglobulin light chain junction region [Macaca mulatta]MOW64145.1 immunoglobulin light chain junction region [Macaca mulatta]
CLQYSSVPFTF